MERRLAAILAADVVGYSRLMEADVPQQCVSPAAPCAGRRSRQLPAHPGVARGCGTLVAHHAAEQAHQDRRKGRATSTFPYRMLAG